MGELRSQRFAKQLKRLEIRLSQIKTEAENSLLIDDVNKLKRQIEAELKRWSSQHSFLQQAILLRKEATAIRGHIIQNINSSTSDDAMFALSVDSRFNRMFAELDNQAKKFDEANKVLAILNSLNTKVSELINQHKTTSNLEAQQTRPLR